MSKSITRIAALTTGVVLLACQPQEQLDNLARDQARKAVNPVLAERFPGVPLEPATNCVINNASASEIFTLARAGAGGLSPESSRLVLEIATRPETVSCLLKDGLAPFVV